MPFYHVPLWLEVEADSPEEAHKHATDWSFNTFEDWDPEDDPIKCLWHGELAEVSEVTRLNGLEVEEG